MSIRNDTEVDVNICLKQLTPLYFQNNLKPGETFHRNVGAVWFTIAGSADRLSNRFSVRISDWTISCPLLSWCLAVGMVQSPE